MSLETQTLYRVGQPTLGMPVIGVIYKPTSAEFAMVDSAVGGYDRLFPQARPPLPDRPLFAASITPPDYWWTRVWARLRVWWTIVWPRS